MFSLAQEQIYLTIPEPVAKKSTKECIELLAYSFQIVLVCAGLVFVDL
jgi:hypothetical protein